MKSVFLHPRFRLVFVLSCLPWIVAGCSQSAPSPDQGRQVLEQHFIQAAPPESQQNLHVEGFRPVQLQPAPGAPGTLRMGCEVVLFSTFELYLQSGVLGTGADQTQVGDKVVDVLPPKTSVFLHCDVDFQRGPNGWNGQVVETTIERKATLDDEMNDIMKRAINGLKDPDLQATDSGVTWQGKPLYQAPRQTWNDLVHKIRGAVRGTAETEGATRPAFLEALYNQMLAGERLIPDPHALAEAQDELNKEIAAEKSGTVYQKALQDRLKIVQAEIKSVQEAEHSPQTVLSMARTISDIVREYAAKNHLPASAPVKWDDLAKGRLLAGHVAETPSGERLWVTEQDVCGRPFIIGPRVGDGVGIAPQTMADLKDKVPGDPASFWAEFYPHRYSTAQAAFDGANAISLAIVKCTEDKKLSPYDDINWSMIEPYMEGGNVAFRTNGNDPKGRPYEIGPTVDCGVHINQESADELAAEIGNGFNNSPAGIFGIFYPTNRKVTADGYRDADNDSLDYAEIRFDPGLLDDDKFVDSWASRHESFIYQQDFNNEFVWSGRRQEIREKLQHGMDHYPTKFRVSLQTQLDKYDPATGAFRIQGLQGVDRLNVYSATFKLPSAMTVTGVPMDAEHAQALVERMLRENNGGRQVICDLKVTVVGKAPTAPGFFNGRTFNVNVDSVSFRENQNSEPFCTLRL